MSQVLGDRRGVSKQGDAFAFERAAKLRLCKKAIDTEQGHRESV
jgi:hypothetical protein